MANPDAIVRWLLGDECHELDDAAYVAGLARRLQAAGVGLDGFGVHLRTLHPETVGRSISWSPDAPVEVRDWAYGFDPMDEEMRKRLQRGEWVAVRLDDPRHATSPLQDFFPGRRLVEFVIVPLQRGSEDLGGLALATRRAGGFRAAERATVRRLLPALRAACEVRVLRRREANLLETYVGPISARRILSGQIQLGAPETLHAALLLCDLRGFTALSDHHPSALVLRHLRTYFDQIVPPILDGGGEILKFMGDAVLAFFRGEGDPKADCAAAFEAARRALGQLDAASSPGFDLRAGVALHHGTVSYGNIGSGHRLDFTIIGRDVNLVSRIQTVCPISGRRLLLSETFARLLSRPDIESIGPFPLKGFDQPPQLFAWIEPAPIAAADRGAFSPPPPGAE